MLRRQQNRPNKLRSEHRSALAEERRRAPSALDLHQYGGKGGCERKGGYRRERWARCVRQALYCVVEL